MPLRIAFPILVLENVVNGRKPHELNPVHGLSAHGVIGTVLIVLGLSLRAWARGHFNKGSLFTTGPYAMVRHPLYLGSFLMVMGALSILRGWANWVVVVPLFLVFYGASIAYEERRMPERFGAEWVRYAARVPALIPRGPGHSFRGIRRRWNWRLYTASGELATTLLSLALPVLLATLEELAF